jgi:hypothetical protein
MKNATAAKLVLPTVVCAWCNGVLRSGGTKVSHGICRPCAKHWFGKIRSRVAATVRRLPA